MYIPIKGSLVRPVTTTTTNTKNYQSQYYLSTYKWNSKSKKVCIVAGHISFIGPSALVVDLTTRLVTAVLSCHVLPFFLTLTDRCFSPAFAISYRQGTCLVPSDPSVVKVTCSNLWEYPSTG